MYELELEPSVSVVYLRLAFNVLPAAIPDELFGEKPESASTYSLVPVLTDEPVSITSRSIPGSFAERYAVTEDILDETLLVAPPAVSYIAATEAALFVHLPSSATGVGVTVATGLEVTPGVGVAVGVGEGVTEGVTSYAT